MNKYKLTSQLRRFGIIKLSDKIRYYFLFLATYRLRRQFFKTYKDVKLPPAYFIYETFNLDYFKFYVQSIETTQWLISYFGKYKKLENLKILDWGCGPGRVIRHLPKLVSQTCSLYGTDYNKKYIEWCSKNIANVTFKNNGLQPPLSFTDNYFDIIYGISIFTHLSEEMHYKWVDELLRVSKPGGIIFITLHGESFKVQLMESEIKKFENGELVIKANTKEGHRTFAAFHPKAFVLKLFGNNTVLEHVPGAVKNGKPQQDIWIIQKV